MLPKRILILGGTAEARDLASRLVADTRFEVISSLAGRTRDPIMPEGFVRIGGFGGTDGLKTYLKEEEINLVADATHPFAAGMSSNAAAACAAAGVPYLRLERPAWSPGPGDVWRSVPDVETAARSVPENAVALITIGRQEIAPFLERGDVHLVLRMIEPPEVDLPPTAILVAARPPFSLQEERETLEAHGITVLVTKNSGGDATAAKLIAARELNVPVIMIERPVKSQADTAASAERMVDLISLALT